MFPMGLSHLGSIARCAFFSPGRVLTSKRSMSRHKMGPLLTVVGTS